MPKKVLITESKIPEDFFSIKLKPISEETQKRLEAAAEHANENIRRNNLIYNSSRAHAGEYPVSSNSGVKGPTLRLKK